MDPAAQLLIAVLLLHAAEGFFLIPRLDFLFVGSPTRCSLLRPNGPLGNANSAIVLMSPFALLSVAFVGRFTPLAINKNLEILLGTIQNSIPKLGHVTTTAALTDEDLNKAQKEGKRVWLSGSKHWDLGSDIESSLLTEQLAELAQLPAEDRLNWFERQIQKMFDIEAIQTRLHQFRVQTQIINLLGILSLSSMFFGLSIIFYTKSGHLYISSIGLFVLCLWLLTLFLTWTAHRKLYPAAKADRYKKLGLLILSPAGVARATAILSRDLLVQYHPLAVASALLSTDDFRKFASETVRDWYHPLDSATKLHPQLHQALQDAMEKIIVDAKLSTEELLSIEDAVEASAKTYCPRCGANYSIEEGFCADCPTIKLIPVT